MSKIDFVKNCLICNKPYTVKIDYSDWLNYKFGRVLIQDAFPYLTPDEQDIITTGICPSCWNDMFHRKKVN